MTAARADGAPVTYLPAGRARTADGEDLAGSAWDVPVPLIQSVTLPPFPVDVFPAWLGDMVTATSVFTQTDPAMAGAVALAVLSACAGGRLEVEARPGWREPVNLFITVAAEPGERKSPVHGALVGPLLAAEQTLAVRVEAVVRENAELKDVAVRAAEHAKNLAAKADKTRREELSAEAVSAALAAEAITVPTLPRLFADDATPEALTSLMADNGGRMALISDEGGIFDTLAGRYSASPNLDPYLKGHAGQPLRVDRKGRPSEFIAKPALTVGVMIQPRVLRRFGGNEDLTGRGLLARFLFVLPGSLTGWRDVDSDPVPAAIAAGYSHRIHDLAATFAEWTDPAVVTLTPEAHRLRVGAAADLEVQLRPGGPLRDMTEWANKLSGATLRLAGLLHVAHHPGDGWRRPIDADRMAEAITLAGFFTAHYRAALAAITTDPAIAQARGALKTLTDKRITDFTRRELHRRLQRQLPTAGHVAAVIDTLTQHGWVRPRADGRYEVHPRAAGLTDGCDR